MLFKQSELQEPSFLDEAMNIISNTSFLSESEGFYHPSMVSIRENVSLGKNLIKLEDLVEYAISNGITNAGQAIQTICEQNGIETDSIGFSVNETSIIADRDMADTVAAFQEGGMDVYINPISSMDPVYQITTSIVEAMIDNAGTENEAYFDHLFESFINDSYEDIIKNEVFHKSPQFKVMLLGIFGGIVILAIAVLILKRVAVKAQDDDETEFFDYLDEPENEDKE